MQYVHDIEITHKSFLIKWTFDTTEGAIKNWQYRDTGNIGHTTHRTNTKKKYTTQKTKKMTNTDPTKNRGWTQVLVKGKQFLPLIRHHHVTHIIKRCWTPLYQTTKNNINKTWTLLQTTGGKEKASVIFLCSLNILNLIIIS